MKIYNGIQELIGKTPMLRANNLIKDEGVDGEILLKLEYFNPAGSVKDRVALSMITDAEEKGLIKSGATIIEPTSGNTGIGIALICAQKGYKAILVMPDTMSVERIQILKAYGAEVVLTDGKLGMQGSIDKAKELNKEIPNSMVCGQFDNPSNPKAHYLGTGKEIWEDTDGDIDVLVAGVGSGGTISGAGKFLKEQNLNIKVIAFEPKNSPMITEGKSGAHNVQGIGANFIPDNYDNSVVDRVETVTEEECYYYAKKLASLEGVLVGISSGGAVAVAIRLLKTKEFKGKKIAVILPDTGSRYMSAKIFE